MVQLGQCLSLVEHHPNKFALCQHYAGQKSASRRSLGKLFLDNFRLATIREVEIGIPSGVAQDPTYLGRRFYLCRPGLRFAHGTGPKASSTTAA